MPSKLKVFTELICAYPWLDDYIIDSSQCSNLLRVGKIQQNMKYTCQTILKVIGKLISNQYVSYCKLCDKKTFNSVEHVICFCTNNDAHRNRVLDAVYDVKGHDGFMSMMSLNSVQQCELLLQFVSESEGDELRYPCIAHTVATLCSSMWD